MAHPEFAAGLFHIDSPWTLYVKLEFRAMTKSQRTRQRAVMISSVIARKSKTGTKPAETLDLSKAATLGAIRWPQSRSSRSVRRGGIRRRRRLIPTNIRQSKPRPMAGGICQRLFVILGSVNGNAPEMEMRYCGKGTSEKVNVSLSAPDDGDRGLDCDATPAAAAKPTGLPLHLEARTVGQHRSSSAIRCPR